MFYYGGMCVIKRERAVCVCPTDCPDYFQPVCRYVCLSKVLPEMDPPLKRWGKPPTPAHIYCIEFVLH